MKKHLRLLVLTLTILILPTGCLKQGETPKIPGVDGPKINVMNGKIILSVGLEKVNLPFGVTLPIPKMPNSDITVGPRMGNGTLIQIQFDPEDVKSEHFRVVPNETLPDGRPFPFLMGGELPAIAFNIPKALDATFYASNKVFGFFIPVKLPREIPGINYRVKINGHNLGIVSLIHADEYGQGSGFVLLLSMQEIQDNPDVVEFLEFSKNRKNRLY